jgi:small subunit ribosomal protein S11
MAKQKAAAKSKSASKATAGRPATAKKRQRRNITNGHVHIYASFNNTIITITDVQGNPLAWGTGGSGFKGARKSTPYAAQVAAKKAALTAKESGLVHVEVFVRGPGTGRDSAIRGVGEVFDVTNIADVTPIAHNGCRPEKERRV